MEYKIGLKRFVPENTISIVHFNSHFNSRFNSRFNFHFNFQLYFVNDFQ